MNMDHKQRSLSKRLSKMVELKVRKGPRLNWKNKNVTVAKITRTDHLAVVVDKGTQSISLLRQKIKQNIKKLPIQKLGEKTLPDGLVTIQYPASRCFTSEQMNWLRGFFPKRKKDVGISKSPEFIKVANCSENEILKNRNYILTKEGEGTLLIHLRNVLSPNAILGLQFLSFVHAFDIKHNMDMKGTTCLASGKPVPEQICHHLKYANNAKNWGAFSKTFNELYVSGQSAQMKYGTDEKQFQIGNLMSRSIIKSSEDKSNYIKNIETRYEQLDNDVKRKCPFDAERKECLALYFSEVLLAFEHHYHYFAKEERVDLDIENVMTNFRQNLHVATNVLDKGESRMHFHLDSASNFPTILTQAPIMDTAFKGGELFLLDNSFVCDYKCGDIVLIPGSKVYHAVLPFSIEENIKSTSEQNPLRFSCSIYNNIDK